MHPDQGVGWSEYLILIRKKIFNKTDWQGEVWKLFTLLLLLFLPLSSFGLGKKIVREYLVGAMADAMPWEMDELEGWLFVASDEGLIQYEGLYPDLFQFNNRRPVRSVKIDPESKRIYAGGISEFGYFQPSSNSSLEYVCLSDSIENDRHIGNIWGIFPDNSNLIVQGDNSVLIYDLNTGKHSVINTPWKLDGSSLIDGVLWIATDDGLKLKVGSNIVNAPGADGLKGKRIRKILPYKKGLMIIASDGIWTYINQQLSKETGFEAVFNDVKEIFTGALRGDNLILGSVSHGLAIVDLKTGNYEIYDESNGLPSNTIISLKFNNEGDLWVGNQYGLSKILLSEPIETIDNNLLHIGSGYVMALKGDKLYMGTNRGLYETPYDAEDQKIGKTVERVGDLRGQVWGLSLIDGELFCSLDQGLYIIGEKGEMKRIEELSGVWDVRKMLGSRDRAYVGTYTGLHLLRKRNGNWVYEGIVEGYPSSMYNFVQESSSVVWNDNAEEGIDRVLIDTLQNRVREIKNYTTTKDGTPLTADVYINRIDNDIYFSTQNGIYIYEPKSGEIVKERDISNLLGNPSGSVLRLKKANGSLLAMTENELIEADPAGILGYNRISLSPSVTRAMHEGDLFFPIGSDYLGYPTRNGYLLFNLSEKRDSINRLKSPSLHINSIRLTSHGDSLIYRGNLANEKYEANLDYKENSVRIEFGSLEELDRGVRYSTRVNNEPWSTPSWTVIKELTDLKPGKYRFEVKALSPDGKETTDSFTFRINPPWWSTKWMWSIYAVLFILLIILMMRLFQLKSARRHRLQMREKEAEMALQEARHQKETEEKDRQIQQLEREQYEKELKHKSQEMANVMMSLTHKNDTLQTVKRELQNIIAMVPRGNVEVRKAIAGLQEKVVVDIKSDDVLKRVEEEFDIVHDNFIKKLREKYPDLNTNEIMLCAYLKMNLSTKEIAPLLNISPRGVETIRYRLRKKLGLDREASLSSFISSF